MFIEMSLDKALVVVEIGEYQNPKRCGELGCVLVGKCNGYGSCMENERKDGKNVIYKLVDYPPEYCKHPMKMCKET